MAKSKKPSPDRGTGPPPPSTPSSPAAIGRRRSPTSSARSTVAQALVNAITVRPRRPRLPVHRRPRRRQDHHRPHPGQGPQLRQGADRRRRATSATSARPSPPARTWTCWRSTAPATADRRDPRPPAERPVPAQPRPLQDLHHRRSPHAHDGGVQRPAEDARGAAAARQVHLRHDRGRRRSRSRSCRAASGSTSPASARPRIFEQLQADRRPARGMQADDDALRTGRPPGRRLDARRPVAARPAARLRRRPADRRAGPRRARHRRRRPRRRPRRRRPGPRREAGARAARRGRPTAACSSANCSIS